MSLPTMVQGWDNVKIELMGFLRFGGISNFSHSNGMTAPSVVYDMFKTDPIGFALGDVPPITGSFTWRNEDFKEFKSVASIAGKRFFQYLPVDIVIGVSDYTENGAFWTKTFTAQGTKVIRSCFIYDAPWSAGRGQNEISIPMSFIGLTLIE